MRISCAILLALVISVNFADVCFSRCLDDQKDLLMDFRSTLVFEASISIKLAKWDHHVDCCSWPGVVCSSNGRVIELDLSSELIYSVVLIILLTSFVSSISRGLTSLLIILTGPISVVSWKELVRLETLDLSNNSFSGSIPADLFGMPSLRELTLSYNRFESLEIMDTNNASFSSLYILDLSHNYISGSIPAYLFGLPSLWVLDLSDNRFETLEIMNTNNASFSLLDTLDLSNNSFSGCIPAELFGMPSLRELRLSDNRFESLEIMDTNNASFSFLDTLVLSNNSFSGSIPADLFGMSSLRKLILSDNRFESLGIMDTNNSSFSLLETLDLSNNNLSETLDLSLFQHWGNLSILDLSFNSLSIKAAKINCSLFPQLSQLYLASSNITAFPDFLKCQISLSDLDLSDNKIRGEIPKWLWNMKSLDYLNLSYNALVDFEDGNRTASLDTLDLRSNFLQGELPSLPPFARHMDFSSNNFSSKFPSEIGKDLLRLFFFSVASNFMEGTIPSTICDAQSLEFLDLSDNHFDGHLPPCILSMTSQSLVYLNLRRNSITGYTSDSFTTNCKLITLEMSGNHIQGKLPKSLANCEYLEFLDLGDNEFEDSFPCWLRNISSLRVLVLRSNLLHGSIRCPDTTREWRTLQFVDLACNKFNDSLSSDTLSSFKGMMTNSGQAEHTVFGITVSALGPVEVIFRGQQLEFVNILPVFGMDLSRNQFSGQIPHMIGSLKLLYTLNLSHNMFSSHIPTSLGNLKVLESLDLSQNRLTGQIPTELAKLISLSVLNLSYNSLEGKIPTGNQFNTFTDESYVGNKALCGFPMPECASPAPSENSSSFSSTIDWEVLVPGFGFLFGAGLTIAPLYFSKNWSRWHDRLVLKVLSLARRPS